MGPLGAAHRWHRFGKSESDTICQNFDGLSLMFRSVEGEGGQLQELLQCGKIPFEVEKLDPFDGDNEPISMLSEPRSPASFCLLKLTMSSQTNKIVQLAWQVLKYNAADVYFCA